MTKNYQKVLVIIYNYYQKEKTVKECSWIFCQIPS